MVKLNILYMLLMSGIIMYSYQEIYQPEMEMDQIDTIIKINQ
jgi:hypothetical protein